MKTGRIAVYALASCALSACSVGPRYHRPAASVPASYKESSAIAYQGSDAGTWRPASPADAALKGAWWRIFNEPELDSLEQQLDINNQTIAQYFQNFMAARAQVAEARAGLFPTVSVDPSLVHSHEATGVAGVVGVNGASSAGATSGAGSVGSLGSTGTSGPAGSTVSATTTGTASGKGGSTITVFSLPADVSWEPDLWGRIRNTVAEYRYAAQVSAADLQNERLSEQASLAEYYFELRGEDALQDIYNRTVAADQQSLDITRGLFETGIDDAEDVAQAQVTLANAQANAVGVAATRAQYEHAIALLIGKPASNFSMPVKSLSTKVPPIPLGIPSALLQRRPDIAAAERTMAEANAEIGIATAAYFPALTLSGSAGFESTTLSSLLSTPSFVWSLGASASEALFDAGLRHATVAQYRATYNADVAAYRQTVLTAFDQVEDGIAALRVYSHQLERQQAAVNAARQYLNIAMVRYQTGIDPYIDVMTAQTTLLADQLTQISEQVTELEQAVQLVQALGGGWDVSQLPAG